MYVGSHAVLQFQTALTSRIFYSFELSMLTEGGRIFLKKSVLMILLLNWLVITVFYFAILAGSWKSLRENIIYILYFSKAEKCLHNLKIQYASHHFWSSFQVPVGPMRYLQQGKIIHFWSWFLRCPLCQQRTFTFAFNAAICHKSLHNSRGDVLVYRKQITWGVFSLLCFPALQILQCPEQAVREEGTVFPMASPKPFLILLLIPLLIFCSVSLLQQAKMKSHSLEHRSQEQPLLQPKQVQYRWQGSEPSAVLTPPQPRT